MLKLKNFFFKFFPKIWSEDTLTYIPLCTTTEKSAIYDSFTEFEPSSIYSTVM